MDFFLLELLLFLLALIVHGRVVARIEATREVRKTLTQLVRF